MTARLRKKTVIRSDKKFDFLGQRFRIHVIEPAISVAHDAICDQMKESLGVFDRRFIGDLRQPEKFMTAQLNPIRLLIRINCFERNALKVGFR